MTTLRRLIARQYAVALLVAIAVLWVRLLVPTGYMPGIGTHGISITICTGMGPQTVALIPGNDSHKPPDHGKADGQPCAFAGLGLLSTGAIDPPVLVAALRFIMRTGLVARKSEAAPQRLHLRPPLRGPPLTA